LEDFPQSVAERDPEYLKLRPWRVLGELTMMFGYVTSQPGADFVGRLFVACRKGRNARRKRIAL